MSLSRLYRLFEKDTDLIMKRINELAEMIDNSSFNTSSFRWAVRNMDDFHRLMSNFDDLIKGRPCDGAEVHVMIDYYNQLVSFKKKVLRLLWKVSPGTRPQWKSTWKELLNEKEAVVE